MCNLHIIHGKGLLWFSNFFGLLFQQNFWQKIGYSGNVIRMMPSAVCNKQADDQPSEAEQIPFTALFDATSTMDQSPALCGTVEAKKWREIPVKKVQFQQAWNFIFQRASPVSFWKGALPLKINLKPMGNFWRGTKAKTRGNGGHGLRSLGVIQGFYDYHAIILKSYIAHVSTKQGTGYIQTFRIISCY